MAKAIQVLKRERVLRRSFAYVIGLFFGAFGVALAVNSELGVSPVNSYAFFLSRLFDLYMGVCIAIILSFFVLTQILLLRREFQWFNLLQIPTAFLLGYFVDLANFLLGDFRLPTYFGQLAMTGISIVLIATGILLYTGVRFFPIPPAEALVVALAYKFDMPFHKVKVLLDSTFVGAGIVLSLIFLGGLYGVREGTILSAVFIGRLMPYIERWLGPLLVRLGVR